MYYEKTDSNKIKIKVIKIDYDKTYENKIKIKL